MSSPDTLEYHHSELDTPEVYHEIYESMIAALEKYGPEFGHELGPRNTFRKNGLDIEEWHVPGFVVGDALKEVQGPFVEMAGPTREGYQVTGIPALPKKLLTSNVFPGTPYFDGQDGHF